MTIGISLKRALRVLRESVSKCRKSQPRIEQPCRSIPVSTES
jgi:hypothetical protein